MHVAGRAVSAHEHIAARNAQRRTPVPTVIRHLPLLLLVSAKAEACPTCLVENALKDAPELVYWNLLLAGWTVLLLAIWVERVERGRPDRALRYCLAQLFAVNMSYLAFLLLPFAAGLVRRWQEERQPASSSSDSDKPTDVLLGSLVAVLAFVVLRGGAAAFATLGSNGASYYAAWPVVYWVPVLLLIRYCISSLRNDNAFWVVAIFLLIAFSPWLSIPVDSLAATAFAPRTPDTTTLDLFLRTVWMVAFLPALVGLAHFAVCRKPEHRRLGALLFCTGVLVSCCLWVTKCLVPPLRDVSVPPEMMFLL